MYNPVANSWTSKATLPQALEFACAAPDSAGNIYILGGYNGTTVIPTVYKFDPVQNVYSVLAPMPTGEYNAACAAYNNRIYVFGGDNGTGNLTQIYDIAGNSWTTGASTPLPFFGGAAAVLGAQIYVAGGYNSVRGYLSALNIYDPATDTWTSAPNCPSSHNETGGVVVNNLLYVVGGESASTISAEVDVYDPTAVWFMYTKN